MTEELLIGLVSISDRASKGVYEDQGIPALQEWFGKALATPWRMETRLIPDEQPVIEATLRDLVDTAGCHLVLTTGGTGPAPRDVTPEATLAVADKVMPGFGEQMRQVSLKFVPTAILSRQVAVIRKNALIINLPGQPKAIRETLEGLKDESGKTDRQRHLRRGALLHRPDRRAVHRDERGGGQGVPPEVGDTAENLNLAAKAAKNAKKSNNKNKTNYQKRLRHMLQWWHVIIRFCLIDQVSLLNFLAFLASLAANICF